MAAGPQRADASLGMEPAARIPGFAAPSSTVTALVADDHPAVLGAMCDLLGDAGVEVIGRASNGEEALAKIETRRPKVALVDVRMPRLSGIELARRVLRASPQTALVFYTGYGDRALVTEALDLGVRGVVLKEAPLQDVVRAVQLVGDGGTYVDPVLAGVLATAQLTSDRPALTQRERDVLRLLSEGLSNEGVGKQLFISAETVRTPVRKAMGKLGAENRTEAVASALRAQLIS
jgi:two-component system response regulator DesR